MCVSKMSMGGCWAQVWVQGPFPLTGHWPLFELKKYARSGGIVLSNNMRFDVLYAKLQGGWQNKWFFLTKSRSSFLLDNTFVFIPYSFARCLREKRGLKTTRNLKRLFAQYFVLENKFGKQCCCYISHAHLGQVVFMLCMPCTICVQFSVWGPGWWNDFWG